MRASAVKYGGVLEATLMSLGNRIGSKSELLTDSSTCLTGQLGGFVFTSKRGYSNVAKIGQTTQLFTLTVNDIDINGLNLLKFFLKEN